MRAAVAGQREQYRAVAMDDAQCDQGTTRRDGEAELIGPMCSVHACGGRQPRQQW